MLLSLAGIPLTAGFVGKFFIVAAGVQANSWTLVTALVVNSAIGLYYYIRILAVMTEQAQREDHAQPAPQPPAFLLGGLSVALLTLGLFWLGVLPEGLMGLIRTILNAQ
jgi:NADH-quinone oxidoreductase subunit N